MAALAGLPVELHRNFESLIMAAHKALLEREGMPIDLILIVTEAAAVSLCLLLWRLLGLEVLPASAQ